MGTPVRARVRLHDFTSVARPRMLRKNIPHELVFFSSMRRILVIPDFDETLIERQHSTRSFDRCAREGRVGERNEETAFCYIRYVARSKTATIHGIVRYTLESLSLAFVANLCFRK